MKSIRDTHKQISFKNLLFVNSPNQGSEPKTE